MNKVELLAALRKTHFAPDIGVLEPLMRPSIRMTPVVVEPADLPLGASRLGGAPDFPAGVDWPRFEGRPLNFLCQLDLAEIQALGSFDDLPESGWFLFFYDAEGQPWGFDPKDRGRWRVLHVQTGSGSLERRERPAGVTTERPASFKACALEMRPEVCLPDIFDLLFPLDVEDDQIFEGYIRFLEETETTTEPFSENYRLLGHPALVQADMREKCQLVANGLYCGDGTGWRNPRAKTLLPTAKEWQLLLQFDTDEEGPGWSWGLGGRLYFWIRQSDLERAHFEEVWAVVQGG
jgi:uncharacterized protein YwqG